MHNGATQRETARFAPDFESGDPRERGPPPPRDWGVMAAHNVDAYGYDNRIMRQTVGVSDVETENRQESGRSVLAEPSRTGVLWEDGLVPCLSGRRNDGSDRTRWDEQGARDRGGRESTRWLSHPKCRGLSSECKKNIRLPVLSRQRRVSPHCVMFTLGAPVSLLRA